MSKNNLLKIKNALQNQQLGKCQNFLKYTAPFLLLQSLFQMEHIVEVKGITLWKLRKFIHTLFPQKFRENNVFPKKVTI